MSQVYDCDGDKESLHSPEEARISSYETNETESNQSLANARVRKQNNALLSRILESKGRDATADDLCSKDSEESSIGVRSHELRTNTRFFARNSLRATRSLDGTTGLEAGDGIIKESSRPSHERISILRSQRRSIRNSSHQRNIQVASARRTVDSDINSHNNEIGSNSNSGHGSTSIIYPLGNNKSHEHEQVILSSRSNLNIPSISEISSALTSEGYAGTEEKQVYPSSMDSTKNLIFPVVKNDKRSQETAQFDLNNAVHRRNYIFTQEKPDASDLILSAIDVLSHREKRVNAMALSRILESKSETFQVIQSYEEESIGVRSHDPSPHIKRETKSRISASQSLDGINDCKEHQLNNRKMKSASATNNHGNNLSARDLRKSLRNGSLRRTLGRLTSRRSRDNEHLANDIKCDVSNQLVDNTSNIETTNTKGDLCDILPGKSIVRTLDEKKDSTGSVSHDSVAKPNRITKGRRASSSGGTVRYENRPTLRRTHSTPEMNESMIRSILKSDDRSKKGRDPKDLSVRFDSIQMREFDLTVGDNPSVSRGVPISLDWNYNPEIVIQSIDEYEAERPPRRHRTALFLAPAIREDMLILEWGATYKELKEVSTMTDTIRRQRWESACQNAMQQKREEMLETTKRRFGRVFQGGKDRELRRLLGEVDKYHNDSHGSI